jgi:hypothetical protein
MIKKLSACLYLIEIIVKKDFIFNDIIDNLATKNFILEAVFLSHFVEEHLKNIKFI